jgi:hypothetical protein
MLLALPLLPLPLFLLMALVLGDLCGQHPVAAAQPLARHGRFPRLPLQPRVLAL